MSLKIVLTDVKDLKGTLTLKLFVLHEEEKYL